MKRGYLSAELDVTNDEIFYGQYMVQVKPVLEHYQARFLIATDKPEVVEGSRVVKRIILLEFDSVDLARKFYYSEEYQKVAKIRFRSSLTHLYIMEGLH